MTKKHKNPEVCNGDIVRITCRGNTRIGKVDTIQYNWQDETIAIEMRDEVHGYVYWKQWTDGGEIEVITHNNGEKK